MILLILLFAIMLQSYSGNVDQQPVNDNPTLLTTSIVDTINIDPEKVEEKDTSFSSPLEDSLYVRLIDSIVEKINRQRNSFTDKQFNDTVNNRLVMLSYKNKELMMIYYLYDFYPSSAKATLYPHNDSLVYVEYILSGPIDRSSLSPTTTFSYYFKDNKQIHQSISYPLSVPYFDTIPFSLEDEDFVKDFENYKKLADK